MYTNNKSQMEKWSENTDVRDTNHIEYCKYEVQIHIYFIFQIYLILQK